MRFLERVYFNAVLAYNALEFLVNVVQYLAVDFQRRKQTLVRVLKTDPHKIGRNLSPIGISAPTVRRSEEHNELRAAAACLRSMERLYA